MFWSCFSGFGKGSGIFWEKDWGSINNESYRAHTVPIIDGWIRLSARTCQHLILMEDGAPGHAAEATQQILMSKGFNERHGLLTVQTSIPLKIVGIE